MGGLRMETLIYFLPCLYAFLACAGICITLNIHGQGILICCVGGALGWFIYLLLAPIAGSEVVQSFFAAVVITLYAEIMARVRKFPVTGYLLVALFPLVPGGGIYYTMEYCIQGETQRFLESLLHTFGVAGALAVGAVLVSSGVRLLTSYRDSRRRTEREEEKP